MRLRRAARGERGQATIEVALLLSLMVMPLVFGLIEMGFLFSSHLTISAATREGARMGSNLANGGGALGCGAGQSPNAATVDAQIIASVERSLTGAGTEINLANITQIRIFQATATGAETVNKVNVWTYTPNTGPVNGTPYSTSDDISVGGDTGQFTNVDNVDKASGSPYKGNGRYDLGNNYNGSSSADCSGSPYHNAWWQVPTPGYPGGLPAGQYRLQITTSGGSTSQDAVNNFSLQATGGVSGVRAYGQSRMCVFNAISGTSIFYLAQIAAVHAGKTLEIKLFDPGDISNTSLFIEQPTAAGYTDATFSWTATGCSGSGCTTSGNNVTSLLTSTAGGTNLFNNQWVTIDVTLATTYNAPTPPGEPGPGWWKIKYATTGTGQDVTTWSVNIRGNPVHLVTP